MRPLVVTLEGGEGSGKSTILKMLEEYLNDSGIDYMCTREPGGVKISESIRTIILDVNNTEMDGRTEALLYAAARRQHLYEKVFPALKEKKIIIFDRFVDSSIVYQGYVRGIGMDEIIMLNNFATEGFLPNLTLYFDVDPEVGIKRVNSGDRHIDRLDLEGMEFHNKVREGYLILVEKYPERIKVIDSNQSIEKVFDQVLEALKIYIEIWYNKISLII